MVKGIGGRKPLNIPLKNVCEAIQLHRSVVAAAQELGCSQGYIFNVLKANGLRLRDGGFYWTGESDLTAALIISHTHTGACQVDKM